MKDYNWAEEYIAEVLSDMQNAGIISGYFRAIKNSELDHTGVDFVIYYPLRNCNKAIPLQVKSSSQHMGKHKKKYGNIPVVACKSKKKKKVIRSKEVLAQQIEERIKLYLEEIKK